MSLMPIKKEYTYEEWLDLANNEETELIDGIIYMRGEPSRRHNRVSTNLILELGTFLKGKKCELYHDPFMVKLNKKTVVRPDILVICDQNKLTDQSCVGAPDLVIEILSPTNAGDDLFTKYNHYLMASVKEYWIVDPIKNSVIVYILQDGRYRGTLYEEKETIPVTVLPDCKINLEIIFK